MGDSFMTKRFLTLLVASGLLISSVHANDSLMDIAQRAKENLVQTYTQFKDEFLAAQEVAQNDCKVIMASTAQELENYKSEMGSVINLQVSSFPLLETSMSITQIGHGNDIPSLALDGIKLLTQTIKPEQAAVMYIKTYSEITDNMLATLPDLVKKGTLAERNDGYNPMVLLGQLMQAMMAAIREKELDLAVAKYVLPKDVNLEVETALIEFAQASLYQVDQELNSSNFTKELCHGVYDEETNSWTTECEVVVDQEAKANFVSNFFIDYLSGLLEALVATLEKNYTIDRDALGLAPAPSQLIPCYGEAAE